MKQLLTFLLIFCISVSATLAIDLNDLEIGGQVRMRGYDLKNLEDYNDNTGTKDWSVFRLKTSLWFKLKVENNISSFIKITNQNWGADVTNTSGAILGENTDANVFVENAYIDISNLFDMNLKARLGRQNLMYGSGFVIFDGQSQTGSTSMYFDGIKLSYDINSNVMLDGFYVKDSEGDRENSSEDDKNMTGLYLTIKECPFLDNGKREVYILNTQEESSTSGDQDLIIYGLRASNKFDMGLDYSAEIAKQTGDQSSTVDKDALGYKLDLGYTFDNANKTRIFAGYTFMSGDEAGSSDNEAWDVVYGGWPQFGDLLAFKYVFQAPVGEASYSNLVITTLGLNGKITDKMNAKVSYSMLEEDEGTDIGTYSQLTLSYGYSKSLGFRVYAAMIDPDSSKGNDKSTELFWEADLKF